MVKNISGINYFLDTRYLLFYWSFGDFHFKELSQGDAAGEEAAVKAPQHCCQTRAGEIQLHQNPDGAAGQGSGISERSRGQ